MERLIEVCKRYFVFAVLLLLFIVPVSGCSVFMAAKQPVAKNIELFKIGTSRKALWAEFGPPLISEQTDGQKVEIFTIIQGYSKLAKTGRAIFHGAADVFTLGLWEIIGTPTELFFNGTEMAFHVIYDDNDQLEEVNIIKMQ
ncbi:MAG: hypothetical protein H0V39_06270 [Nitrosomonas sp.]|nr:hypothetical protein [Nitrosomonas sp.]